MNPTSIYQAQGAFCGEAIGKFDIQYKSIIDNLKNFIDSEKDFKNFCIDKYFKSQLVNQFKHCFLALSLIRNLNQICTCANRNTYFSKKTNFWNNLKEEVGNGQCYPANSLDKLP